MTSVSDSSDYAVNRQFSSELESLRGFLALQVTISHSLLVLWSWPLIPNVEQELPDVSIFFLLQILNGHSAVIAFFVLSGIVLGWSLDRSTNVSWPLRQYIGFLIARCFRIYPAAMLSIGLTLLFMYEANYPPLNHASNWFALGNIAQPSWTAIAADALLVTSNINPPTWTLRTEIGTALCFPLLWSISRRCSILGNAVALGIIMILPKIYGPPGHIILAHLYQFYVGLIISLVRVRPTTTVNPSNYLSDIALLNIGAITYFFAPALLRISQIEGPIIHITTTFGAALIMLILITKPSPVWLTALLRNSAIRHLGRISYSFYVLHWPILYVLIVLVHLTLNLEDLVFQKSTALVLSISLAFFTVCLTVIIATLSYFWIELPGVRLGRRLCTTLPGRKMKRRPPAPEC